MRPEILEKIKSSPLDQVDLDEMHVNDDEIDEIVTFIAQTKPEIKEIILDHNSLTDEGAKILASKLAALQELTDLRLQFNSIDRSGITAIYSLMETHPSLRFYFCGNKLRNASEMYEIKNNVLAKLGRTASAETKKETPLPHPKKKKWWSFF